MLEASLQKQNCAITLTYSDEYLPKGGSLAPEEIRDWLKRFRKSVEPFRIRYYCVGEYGEENWRPHYHVIVFGYPGCRFGRSRYTKERQDCCEVCDRVRDTWGRGNVLVDTVDIQTAQYVAGYTIKKMTKFDDPRLQDRMRATGTNLHPEFARMSLKPGIGAGYIPELASTMMEFDLEKRMADVPSAIRQGKRLMPLGQYLRRLLRVQVGMDKKAPQATLDAQEAEVLEMCRAKGIDTESKTFSGDLRRTAIKNMLIDAGYQRNLSQKARMEIYKKRKSLDG